MKNEKGQAKGRVNWWFYCCGGWRGGHGDEFLDVVTLSGVPWADLPDTDTSKHAIGENQNHQT